MKNPQNSRTQVHRWDQLIDLRKQVGGALWSWNLMLEVLHVLLLSGVDRT